MTIDVPLGDMGHALLATNQLTTIDQSELSAQLGLGLVDNRLSPTASPTSSLQDEDMDDFSRVSLPFWMMTMFIMMIMQNCYATQYLLTGKKYHCKVSLCTLLINNYEYMYKYKTKSYKGHTKIPCSKSVLPLFRVSCCVLLLLLWFRVSWWNPQSPSPSPQGSSPSTPPCPTPPSPPPPPPPAPLPPASPPWPRAAGQEEQQEEEGR